MEQCDNAEYQCSGDGCTYRDIKSKIEEHVGLCENVLEKCINCEKYVKRKEMRAHEDVECEGAIVECEYCVKKMQRKEMPLHSREECVKKVKEMYERKIAEMQKEIERLKSKVNEEAEDVNNNDDKVKDGDKDDNENNVCDKNTDKVNDIPTDGVDNKFSGDEITN